MLVVSYPYLSGALQIIYTINIDKSIPYIHLQEWKI